jgi:hypothetical protein
LDYAWGSSLAVSFPELVEVSPIMTLELPENRGAGLEQINPIRIRLVSICRGFTIIDVLYFRMSNE